MDVNLKMKTDKKKEYKKLITTLKVCPCNYEAAKFAVLNYHYSKAMPAGKLIKIGVWEDEKFIGAVLFGRGANNNIGKSYNLEQTQVCELVRVALRKHEHPVTEILGKSIKILKETNPGLKLIVSYADSNQGHLGIIYQAGNWIYSGSIESEIGYKINNKIVHGRSVVQKYGTSSIPWLQKNINPNIKKISGKPKFKYLYPLNKTIRKQIKLLSKTYPKILEA